MDENEKAWVGRLEAEVLVLRELVRALVSMAPATPGTNGVFGEARRLTNGQALMLTIHGQKHLPDALARLNPLTIPKAQL